MFSEKANSTGLVEFAFKKSPSGQSPAGDLLIKIIEPYSFLFGVAIAMDTVGEFILGQ
jgi:hypothetical protein